MIMNAGLYKPSSSVEWAQMGVVSLLLCHRRQCPQRMGVESVVTPANVVLKIASTQQAQDRFTEPVPLFSS